MFNLFLVLTTNLVCRPRNEARNVGSHRRRDRLVLDPSRDAAARVARLRHDPVNTVLCRVESNDLDSAVHGARDLFRDSVRGRQGNDKELGDGRVGLDAEDPNGHLAVAKEARKLVMDSKGWKR